MQIFAQKDGSGIAYPLVELSGVNFDAAVDRIGAKTIGVPVFWCKNRGCLPQSDGSWRFIIAEDFDNFPTPQTTHL